MPVAIRTYHGSYLRFDPDNRVVAGSDKGDWEKVDIEDHDGDVALKAESNGKYVQAHPDGDRLEYADDVGDWGKFEKVDLGDGKFALKARSTGKFVCCNPEGDLVTADRDNQAEWETFSTEDY